MNLIQTSPLGWFFYVWLGATTAHGPQTADDHCDRDIIYN